MKTLKVLTCVLAGAALVGCGGGGPSTKSLNPYTGALTGTWTSTTMAQDGNVNVTVYSDGSISGTMSITQFNATGNFIGQVDSYGKFTGSASFGSLGNYYMDGNMTMMSGTNSASFTIDNGTSYNANWSLKPPTSTS